MGARQNVKGKNRGKVCAVKKVCKGKKLMEKKETKETKNKKVRLSVESKKRSKIEKA